MKKVLPFIGAQIITLTPLIALAQGATGNDFKGITKLFENAITFINNTLIPLVFAVALLVFFYGIFKYFILGGGDDSEREAGKKLVLWAIVGFVVMASIYGIVALIAGGLGIDNQNTIKLPVAPNR